MLYAWILSLRLKTLPLACCGIVLGASLAAADSAGVWHWGTALAALVTALLLQIVANLANDYGDYVKAADSPERLGPQRGIQLGLIRPAQLQNAIVWASGFAALSGLALVRLSCQSLAELFVFLGLGLFSLVAAITYTVGRHAYGYRGLGDFSVLVFFGWVSVAGSFYLLSKGFDLRVLMPATACGLLSVLVLNVNNLREMEEDKKHGKITLAVRLGARGARRYHIALLLAALALLAASAWMWTPLRPWVWLWLLALPLAVRHLRAALAIADPSAFRAELARAVQINLLALGGFSAGLWARFA